MKAESGAKGPVAVLSCKASEENNAPVFSDNKYLHFSDNLMPALLKSMWHQGRPNRLIFTAPV